MALDGNYVNRPFDGTPNSRIIHIGGQENPVDSKDDVEQDRPPDINSVNFGKAEDLPSDDRKALGDYLKRNHLVPTLFVGKILSKVGKTFRNTGESKKLEEQISAMKAENAELNTKKANLEEVKAEIEAQKKIIKEKYGVSLSEVIGKSTSSAAAFTIVGLIYNFFTAAGHPEVALVFGLLTGVSTGLLLSRPEKHYVYVNGERKGVMICPVESKEVE
jgi:hypothetical protein